MAIDVTKNVEFGGTYTYDDAFESRASADLTIRFGGGSYKKQTKAEEQPQIKQLSATPSNRDVRVHDALGDVCFFNFYSPAAGEYVRIPGIQRGAEDKTGTEKLACFYAASDLGSFEFDDTEFPGYKPKPIPSSI